MNTFTFKNPSNTYLCSTVRACAITDLCAANTTLIFCFQGTRKEKCHMLSEDIHCTELQATALKAKKQMAK